MAEIHIQRKGMPLWPLLATLAVVVAVILIWSLTRDPAVQEVAETPVLESPADGVPPSPDRAPTTGVAPATAMEEYTTYVERDDARMGPEHEFSSGAIQRLADVIEGMAARPEEAGVRAQIETMRARASDLRESPTHVVNHAGMVREAFDAAADALSSLHETRFAEDADLQRQVESLRRDAAAVNPNQQLLDQRDAVHAFLGNAGDVLHHMERSS